MQDDLLQSLIVNQNPDGGWGYFPAKHSALEPTAFSLLALKSTGASRPVVQKSLRFLKALQGGTGGWPVNLASQEPSPWATAIAGLALYNCEGESQNCQGAAQFLLNSFSRMKVNWLIRFRERLGWTNSFNIDWRLGGWGWNPETAKWVEPTCYSLLFLNFVKGFIPASSLAGCLSEGEKMVYDRMCNGGGWNYGNAHVLGEALLPFPLTTAQALIALQRYPFRRENQLSLQYLQSAAEREPSALALCFSSLCLDLYKREGRFLLSRLECLYSETGFFGNLSTKALALLAVCASHGRNVFQYASA